MGFDKHYPNRKDKRRKYRGAKSFDASCRNHGSCDYCQRNRQHTTVKRKQSAEDKLHGD